MEEAVVEREDDNRGTVACTKNIMMTVWQQNAQNEPV